MLSVAGQVAAALWQLSALAFLLLVVVGIRKARARGKRLFRDEPLARVRALSQDTSHQHEQDAL